MRLTLLLVAAALGSCRANSSPAIAVVPKATYGEYWKAVHAGALEASRELGIPIIWKGPLKEDDRDQQMQIVENFTNMGVRGIVLAPLDDAALRAPVLDATRLGIPVVVIDSALKSDAPLSFIATDNEAGGRLAAEHLAERLGGHGDIVLLRYQEGSASTTQRERGFLEAISRHEGLRVVSAQQYAGATTETAVKASENILASHRSSDGVSVKGIFCPSESTTFGMLIALRQAGLAGKVLLVGFDSSTKLIQGLEAGDIDALVLQDPTRMGYLGVRTLTEHLGGTTPAARIDTDLMVATRANMNEPRVRKLLGSP